MKKTWRLLVFILILLIIAPNNSFAIEGTALGCRCYCGKELPPPCSEAACKQACGWSGSSGSAYNSALSQSAYQLGYALGQWLFSSDSNPQAKLQKQQMMEELQRRKEEAERQHREEEAQRLDVMYNHLSSKLKLSGLPSLQMKGLANKGSGLKLKRGDNPDGHAGVEGLPGIYLNDDKTPYGIPGLPGIYTGGPRQGSGPTSSKLALKRGDSNTEPREPVAFDPGKMTPQQLADVAELFSKLPPEEQERLIREAQHNSATARVTTTIDNSSSVTTLQRQADASQAAAATPNIEDASMKARAGFDQPLSPTQGQLERFDSHQGPSLSMQEAHPAVTKAAATVSPVTSSSASNKQHNQARESSLQDKKQMMSSVDEPLKQQIQEDEEIFQNSTRNTRQLDSQNQHNVSEDVHRIDHASSKKIKAKTEKVQKGWQKALGCAMEEVYARAELLGPNGVTFSQELHNEMKRVFNESGKPVKDINDDYIVNLHLNRQISVVSGSAERQFIVEVAVHSKSNGNIDVDVQSYFSESAGKKDKQENLQNFLVLNKYGEVIMGQKSAAVNACLAR